MSSLRRPISSWTAWRAWTLGERLVQGGPAAGRTVQMVAGSRDSRPLWTRPVGSRRSCKTSQACTPWLGSTWCSARFSSCATRRWLGTSGRSLPTETRTGSPSWLRSTAQPLLRVAGRASETPHPSASPRGAVSPSWARSAMRLRPSRGARDSCSPALLICVRRCGRGRSAPDRCTPSTRVSSAPLVAPSGGHTCERMCASWSVARAAGGGAGRC
mmetsp:Transcript_36706/g.121635  ORF Transcript_36706/g.121635 Transcript_36706/m.121635 type:complete len:215 (-) Transcript_36706:191-835(-)